ncbi:hypothetical protein [Nocardioides sp. TF02-7]|uniref:hypothetical protein n=1 Tax=Nocardioides sp. TF02-7 TaxID=2917724 RepID=UPI001F0643B1|nr:hypothetical protein [Nocardioides sp. TF02-7]UMG92013.1 hypothetical protein MF408_18785 [Nocardioides sp. TF02-7]
MAISSSVQTRPDSSTGTTQACTSSTTVLTSGSAALPQVAKTPRKIRKAIRMLTLGPPAITTIFFQGGIL